jgi:hypothetical protein
MPALRCCGMSGAVASGVGRRPGFLDPAAAKQPLAVIDHRRLAGRDAELGLVEADRAPSSRAGTGRLSERTLTSTSPAPRRASSSCSTRASLTASACLGPTTSRRSLGLDPHHVERLGLAADLQPAALADGEVDDPRMLAEHPPAKVDDLARRLGLGPQPLDQPGIVAVGHEADVLAVGLGRDDQPGLGGAIARTSALGSSPIGKRRRSSCSAVVP